MPGRWFEPLLYVASEAWGAKKNQDPEEWGFESGIDYETGGNAARWPKRKEIVLSKAQIEEQKELTYQRAVSKVVHCWRAGRYSQVVETLEPYEPGLSHKLRAILNDARTKAAAAAPQPEERA